ncbi:hypothetical protein L7F22_007107 [Adiantum nelumboides]|nr:hypothetical protein [Adiantum nelumboides]
MTVPILSEKSLSREPVRMLTSLKLPYSEGTHMISTLELSTLDMLFDNYISVLLFYDVAASQAAACSAPPAAHVNAAEPVRRLQRAVEEMLVHYPCAGGLLVYNEGDDRLEVKYAMPTHLYGSSTKGSSYGNGNDKHLSHDAADLHETPPYGVHFHVAHANVSLADLGDVSNPHPALDVLYPKKPIPQLDSKCHPLPRFVMAFQITMFKCGGFTLGHTCSHAYADGHTGAGILQNLCSIARGDGLANFLQPISSRRAVINAREPPSPTIPHTYIKAQKNVEPDDVKRLRYGTATRFRFTMDALEELRASALTPEKTKGCSRNQALVALLWTAFARVSLKVHGLPRNHDLNFWVPMNMRTRGLSMGYMGNALCELSVPATLEELSEKPLSYVVDKIVKTIESFDVVEGLQSLVDYLEVQFRDGLIPSIEGVGMPSLVALPFYDTDCGWGTPTYVARPSQQLCNRCIILDHPTAKAWNVLVVFASTQELACFQESIALYIS